MLESLINPRKAERKPWELFFIGLLYTVLAIFLSNWLFASNPVLREHISMVTVFFVVMFSIPFVYYTIRLEEKKDIQYNEERIMLREHSKALMAFMFLFLGFIVAFSGFFVLLPSHSYTNFQAQVETYCQINSYSEVQFDNCVEASISGKLSSNAEYIAKEFKLIFFNNLNVMLLSILFSFFFGAGAIFILTWNASVIGAAIGIFAKTWHGLPFGFLRFMIHGTPEILAYFVAGLAGGIISTAVIRHHFEEDKFKKIMKDSLILLVIAILLLFVGTVIEVFVTPSFFA
ncbi:MAG: stage II sporulation protein M [Nanoarchaeota archaeon]|nr:stage II sporulation protein M [Nanoarchaeota archaeon]